MPKARKAPFWPAGETLRDLFRDLAADLSYVQIAAKAGVSRATLHNLMDGKTSRPHRSVVAKIGKAIRVPAARVEAAALNSARAAGKQ